MEALFLRLLNTALVSTWLVLAVLLLRLLLRRAPKWARVALWGVVAVRLVWPFSLQSVFSLVPSAQVVTPEIVYEAHPALHTGIPAVNQAVNPVMEAAFAPEAVQSANPLQVWSFVGAVVWLLGLGVMAAYAAISYGRIRRRVAAAVRLRADLWVCDEVDSPFILGLLRPRIYLPSDLEEGQIPYVEAHERAHLRRRDHWWKPLGFGLLAVYWFHPLLWVAYALLCRDIELACDERVIRNLGAEEKRAYSRALLSCSVRGPLVAACPLAFGEVGVKARIRAVLNDRKPAFWLAVLAVIACGAAAVCFLTDPQVKEATALRLTEARTGWRESSYRVEASLTPVEADTPELSQELLSQWEACSAQSPEAQMASSTAPGLLSRSFASWLDAWEACGTTFGGVRPAAPLEGAFPREGDVRLTWTGEADGTVTGVSASARYQGEGAAVELSALLPLGAAPYAVSGVWDGRVRFATRQEKLTEDVTALVLDIRGAGTYDRTDAFFAWNNILYTLHVTGESGRAAVEETLAAALEVFRLAMTKGTSGGPQRLSLNDCILLSGKGMDLTPADLTGFRYTEVGSGLYIRCYPINDLYELLVGSRGPEGELLYAELRVLDGSGDAIDIRTDSVTDFITSHRDAVPQEAPTAIDFTWEGTTFTYGDATYDLTELAPAMNAILACDRVGRDILIEGHINPRVGVYLIYDTEERNFTAQLTGSNLIWQGEDLTTGLYTLQGDILDYTGELVASVDLAEGEYLCALAFSEDGRAVEATVLTAAGEERTETIPLSDRGTAQGDFANIMGFPGRWTEEVYGPWRQRTYYAQTAAGLVPVAESFGFDDRRDYAVDLDGDGVMELVCNCVYGGDGYEAAYVYRRVGDAIERGSLDWEALDLPGWDGQDSGVAGAPGSRYEGGVFRVTYPAGGQVRSRTVRGLEAVAFTPYCLWRDGSRLTAYQRSLRSILERRLLPDGRALDYDGSPMEENRFALLDVDGDGGQELLLDYLTPGVYAGYGQYVFGYDGAAVEEEFSAFNGIRYYSNGLALAPWSHNHSRGEAVWPYTVSRYNRDTGRYEGLYMVEAWDRQWHPMDFPDEVDADGDGVVYRVGRSVPSDRDYMSDVQVLDLEAYSAWRTALTAGAAELDIPWQSLTAEHIAALTA